jgi:hypothetical protein
MAAARFKNFHVITIITFNRIEAAAACGLTRQQVFKE